MDINADDNPFDDDDQPDPALCPMRGCVREDCKLVRHETPKACNFVFGFPSNRKS